MTTKRFKVLNGALNYLRTSDTGANPEAPAGTPLKEFQDWKKGARNISYTRDAASLPGELLDVVINPFGLDLDGASLTIVPLSKRVKDNIPGTATLTAGNITETVPSTAKKTRGFIPAKATISVPSGSTSTADRTSQLTGVKYKPSNTVSYTIPYGQKTGATREQAVRAEILAAVEGVTGSSVSFASEDL